MAKRTRGIRIEYFLMLIVTFFWALGHPLGKIIVQRVHPFQLGTVTLGTGFIGLLIFLIVTGRIKKLAKISLRNAERLIRLVYDILDVSRLDNDTIKFEMRKILSFSF